MSSVDFFVHDAAGRILRAGLCRDVDVPFQAMEPGEVSVAAPGRVEPFLFYVLNGVVTPRPASAVAGSLNGNTITLTGVPMGCTVNLSGSVYTSTVMDDPSGILAFVAPGAGSYTVNCDPWPTLPYAETFTVP